MSDLRTYREAAGLSQADLAELAGTSQPQVKRLEAGERKLTKEWAVRLAPHLGVQPERLLFRGDQPIFTPVIGYVGAGQEAHFEPVDLDEVPAPDNATEHTVAVVIRGDSMGSFFDGWLVFYDNVQRPVTSDLIGKICVVGLADGRTMIKKLQRSKIKGLFHLLSQNQEPIMDVPVEWAALVKNMVPR
jgi:transcriptional regulator with XRE-family HTH domain